MNGRGMYLIGMLVLLFLANLAMLIGMTNWPIEGFAATVKKSGVAPAAAAAAPKAPKAAAPMLEPFEDVKKDEDGAAKKTPSAPLVSLAPGAVAPATGMAESFMDYLQNGFGTAPIGSYDGRNMTAGLPAAAQGFRANHPDEPLNGPYLTPAADNQSGLFIFQNNQCKPECCGSTLACDGGCVCTTPQQRDFINTRGGNRMSGDF
jgi:hypothetical protein